MSSEALFSLRNVAFSFGCRFALGVPELDIRDGEILALVGPNGSGKTTLLKILNDLLRPSSGIVLFRGRPAAGNPELRNRSVYVHQSPYPLAGTVNRNVAYGLKVRRLPKAEVGRRVDGALCRLGLAGFGRRDAKRLSGGETQRVALARALAIEPEVFLLDEPTAQTDRASAERIRDVLIELANQGGKTIVFASHDAAFAEAIADRAAFLQDGRLVRIEPGRRPMAGTSESPTQEVFA
ncbi:MAG TPA: energy-coupling factor ABC transporter ATP-binding protein [Magnetospirillaceae bacterium]|nr:energy-coupling factor ABC transporter ATP-binding protein [Magnetospirillaceae bacterium]